VRRSSDSVWLYVGGSLLVATTYFIFGRLGLLLAIPPGFAAPVWPAAGVALTAVLIWGRRAWPGVWLGSFAMNLWLSQEVNGSLNASAWGLAAAIAVGAGLQAVLGGALGRSLLKMERPFQVFIFLALTCPIACLCSATIGVSALALFNAIEFEAFAANWGTWWLGDSLGALVFAAIGPAWLNAHGGNRVRRIAALAAPSLLMLSVIVFAFVRVRAWERDLSLFPSWGAWGILIAGFLFTGLMGAFTLWSMSRSAEIERQVEQRTRALHASNVSLAREIQERKRAERALLQANRVKATFLSKISHELRTPLNGVIGANQLLMRSGLTEEQLQYARTNQASAENLLAIIEGLLDFSKMERGQARLQSEEFELAPVLADTVNHLRRAAQRKGIELTCAIDHAIPPKLRGDPERLRRMVYHLTHNAVKFTHRGSVNVRAALESQGDAWIRLRIEVEDTGIGLRAEQIDRLFESFAQVDESSTRKHGGVGLGLATVKRLAGMMDGDVGVKSREGDGSCFWLEIRLSLPTPPDRTPQPDQNNEEAPETAKADAADQETRQALVVEDNPVNQMIVVRMLAKLGLGAHIAANGHEAVDAVRRDSFKVVLMDCQMPEMDGYEATAKIRRLPDKRGRTPIIALTANAVSGDRERCLAAGMDDYLVKPVNMDDLAAAMRRWRIL